MPANLLAVEVPGAIKTEDGLRKVIRALGGEAAIAESMQNGEREPLVMLIDPDDPYSRCILASLLKTANNIALAVKRRKLRRTLLCNRSIVSENGGCNVHIPSPTETIAAGSSDDSRNTSNVAPAVEDVFLPVSGSSILKGLSLPKVTLSINSPFQRIELNRIVLSTRPALCSEIESDIEGEDMVVVEEELDVVEIVFHGRVPFMFRFDNLADFHCAPPRGDKDRLRIYMNKLRSRYDSAMGLNTNMVVSDRCVHENDEESAIDAKIQELLNAEIKNEFDEDATSNVDRVHKNVWSDKGVSESDTLFSSQIFDPLFIPPPVFTKIVTPFAYRYEDNPLARGAKYIASSTSLGANVALQDESYDDSLEAGIEQSSNSSTVTSKEPSTDNIGEKSLFDFCLPRKSGTNRSKELHGGNSSYRLRQSGMTDDSMNPVAKFTDKVLPSRMPSAASKYPCDVTLLEECCRLFHDRPLWTRPMFELRFGSTLPTQWRRKAVYARLSFVFTNGPWRGCMCRYGFDPRISSEREKAAKYQTIDFRDPHFRHSKWISKRSLACNWTAAGLRNGDDLMENVDQLTEKQLTFCSPAQHYNQLFQLCDLADTTIQQILRDAPFLETCSAESGWYPKDVIAKVRDIMLLRSQQMREQAELANQRSIIS